MFLQERPEHSGQQHHLKDGEQRQRDHLLRLHGQLCPLHHPRGRHLHWEAGMWAVR